MNDPAISTETAPAITWQPSSLLRRVAGLIYDWVAVLAIVMVVGMICQAATRGQLVQTGTHVVIAWWYRPLQYLVIVAYFMASWLRGGQTLGMRPWRMYLRMRDGSRIRWRAAIVRAIVVSLPMLLLSIGHGIAPHTAILILLLAWVVFYAVALFDPQRCALHDIIAGTAIVHMVVPRLSRQRPSTTNPDTHP
ncbi:MAG TPA: RDD family protein [Rhodanobacteraceae bacterium]